MKYKSILFEPWVGKDYTTGGVFNKKVLVLGESHYCNDLNSGKCKKCVKVNMRSECFSQTQDVIEEFVNDYRGESYQQTFLCFERALAGRELTQNEREMLIIFRPQLLEHELLPTLKLFKLVKMPSMNFSSCICLMLLLCGALDYMIFCLRGKELKAV